MSVCEMFIRLFLRDFSLTVSQRELLQKELLIKSCDFFIESEALYTVSNRTDDQVKQF